MAIFDLVKIGTQLKYLIRNHIETKTIISKISHYIKLIWVLICN